MSLGRSTERRQPDRLAQDRISSRSIGQSVRLVAKSFDVFSCDRPSETWMCPSCAASVVEHPSETVEQSNVHAMEFLLEPYDFAKLGDLASSSCGLNESNDPVSFDRRIAAFRSSCRPRLSQIRFRCDSSVRPKLFRPTFLGQRCHLRPRFVLQFR